MFGHMTESPGGTWLQYPMGGAALAAHLPSFGADRVTVFWKGDASIKAIGAFFVAAADRVCPGPARSIYIHIVADSGPRDFEFSRLPPTLDALSKDAQFMRIECRKEPVGQRPREDVRSEPDLVVWANFDSEPESLDLPHQSIGIQMRVEDLEKLERSIALAVSGTKLHSYLSDTGYDREETLFQLEHLKNDIAEISDRDHTY
jgi:hypothetical protein